MPVDNLFQLTSVLLYNLVGATIDLYRYPQGVQSPNNQDIEPIHKPLLARAHLAEAEAEQGHCGTNALKAFQCRGLDDVAHRMRVI